MTAALVLDAPMTLRLGLPLATKDAALRRAAAALGVRLLGT
jgi:hypothetical protein